MGIEHLFSLQGKVALVTGDSRGIGFMIARGFLDAGARVYISARKERACEKAAAELSGFGDCTAIPADVSSVEGADHLLEEVRGREPELHVLVNNAGTSWGASLDEYPDFAWAKVWDVNVKGIFHLTRGFLPELKAAAAPDDPARVINIGSIDGLRVPTFENYAYAASKAGVHMLTRQLAHRLRADNITVNAIAPGLFHSRMTDFFLKDNAEAASSFIPLGRIGRDDDMAGAAIYLASRAGSYLTGAVIPVDGGVSTHG